MVRYCLLAAWAVGLTLTEGGQRAPADEPAEAVTTYYLGETKMMSPDGKLLRTSLSLVKRVVDQKAGRIEEHVLSVGEKESKAFVATLEVRGARFAVSERSGAFTGDGELVGEAWKWTEWKSVTKRPGRREP